MSLTFLIISIFVFFWFFPLNIVLSLRNAAVPAINWIIASGALTYITFFMLSRFEII